METIETPIYSTNGNVISRSKAIIAGTTFSMRNITSVRTTYNSQSRSAGIICFAVAALLLAVKYYGGAVFVLILGFICVSVKPTFTIVIMTTNGKEFGALRTHDPAEAKRIVDAFNQAIEQLSLIHI